MLAQQKIADEDCRKEDITQVVCQIKHNKESSLKMFASRK